jgi:hypothetical protein
MSAIRRPTAFQDGRSLQCEAAIDRARARLAADPQDAGGDDRRRSAP